jgi:hypothetical protein
MACLQAATLSSEYVAPATLVQTKHLNPTEQVQIDDLLGVVLPPSAAYEHEPTISTTARTSARAQEHNRLISACFLSTLGLHVRGEPRIRRALGKAIE